MAKDNSQERFARLVGISQPEVSQLLRKGVLSRGADLNQWHKEYLDNLRKVASGWRSDDGRIDRMKEAALLDRCKREQLEIVIAEKKGDLVPRPVIAEALKFSFASVKSKLLSAPNRLRSVNPHAPAKLMAQFEDIIREILTELSHERYPASIDDIAKRYFRDLHAAAEAKPEPVGRRKPHPKSRKQRRTRQVAHLAHAADARTDGRVDQPNDGDGDRDVVESGRQNRALP